MLGVFMKKTLFVLLMTVVVSYFLMINFVGNIAEKGIKNTFTEYQSVDSSVELLSYQRDFFSATAISKVSVQVDPKNIISFKTISTIHHYPHQALITNIIEVIDPDLRQRTESYFGMKKWISSEERIDLFSQLTGKMTIVEGGYQRENETLVTQPVILDYEIDLKDIQGDFGLYWGGLEMTSYNSAVNLKSLQLKSHIGDLAKSRDYDYTVNIEEISLRQETSYSLMSGLSLKGSSQEAKDKKTFDTSNELILNSYVINENDHQTFKNNRIKLTLAGLYQPAFELLSSGVDDKQEVENALIDLVNNGVQITLSELASQTPWGEVEGKLDLTLDKGASLTDIIVNPYTLFDYTSGNLSLVLPVTLLYEPAVAELLQLGLMTGFLEMKSQTLNLQTSFQQGELIVNGRVIPL